MAKQIKLAATAQRCGAVAQNASKAAINQAVIEYIEQVLANTGHQNPDLLLFPEMCDMPCDMPMEKYLEYARDNDETVLNYVKNAAKENNIWIAFSAVVKSENGSLRNSTLLINRNGETECIYSKIYLTQGEREAGLEAGTAPLVHKCELGNIGFAICFDLNFTQLAMQYRKLGANLILFSSLFHGGLLQSVWAFSARSFLLAACGGISADVVLPSGEIIAESTLYYPELTRMVNLDYELFHLDFNKPKLEQACLKYKANIKIHDPGKLASVMLTSEFNSLTVPQIIEEFALEPLDAYLNRFL